jgi:hypothetical protein
MVPKKGLLFEKEIRFFLSIAEKPIFVLAYEEDINKQTAVPVLLLCAAFFMQYIALFE